MRYSRPPNTAADFPYLKICFFLVLYEYDSLDLPPFSNAAVFSPVPRAAVMEWGGDVDCIRVYII